MDTRDGNNFKLLHLPLIDLRNIRYAPDRSYLPRVCGIIRLSHPSEDDLPVRINTPKN
jgi:hypothetical protein